MCNDRRRPPHTARSCPARHKISGRRRFCPPGRVEPRGVFPSGTSTTGRGRVPPPRAVRPFGRRSHPSRGMRVRQGAAVDRAQPKVSCPGDDGLKRPYRRRAETQAVRPVGRGCLPGRTAGQWAPARRPSPTRSYISAPVSERSTWRRRREELPSGCSASAYNGEGAAPTSFWTAVRT